MGNLLCCAAPSGGSRPKVYGRFNTDGSIGTLTKDGLYLEVSYAEWAANNPCEDRHLVRFLNNDPSHSSVLVGVFDGIGGPEAAQLCKANAAAAFDDCLAAANGNVQAALSATFRRLDDEFFETDQTPEVKAYVGAEVTMVHVDLRSHTCTVASHGSCLVTKGAAKGGFSGQRVIGRLLNVCPGNRREAELARLLEAFRQLPQGVLEEVDGTELVMGLSPTTRAIGLGVLKRRDLAEWHNRMSGGLHPVRPLPSGPAGSQYIISEPFVGTSEVAEDDQAITLGSSGLWRLVSPTSAAAWCFAWQQHWQQGGWEEGLREEEEEPAQEGGAEEGDEVTEQSARPPRLAAGLVLQGLASAASRELPAAGGRGGKQHQRRGRRGAFPCVDDLEAVPCSDHSGEVGGRGSAEGSSKGSKAVASEASRTAYHDDLTCITVSWHRRLSPGAAPVSLDERPVGSAGMMASPSPLKARCNRRRVAAERWEMLRSVYRFLVSRRRTLLDAWKATVDEAVNVSRRAAFERARRAEVDAWKSEGRAIMVSDSGTVSAVDMILH